MVIGGYFAYSFSLTIKKIMDKLRHGIYIESEVDQGTTVYLYLEREKRSLQKCKTGERNVI